MKNYSRKVLIWSPFLLLLFYIFTFQEANSHSSAPDAGKVQDPVNNGTCAQSGCHSSFSPFSLTRANVTIGTTALNQVALTGFQYTGGTQYIINFTALGGSNRPGFEMSALTSANANAGTFALTNTSNTTLQTFGGIKYVGHKSASSNSSWTFNWTSPATSAGNITFYTAVNRSNSNNNTSGDSIFHKQFVISPAALSANAGNDVTVCPNTSIQLQASAINGSGTATFSWGASASLSCTTCSNPVATPSSTTTYTVTVTDGGQTAADAVTVNTFSTSQPNINATANTVCPNSTVTLSSSGFSSYLWSTGSTALSATVSASGTYSLTATDANSCTTSKSISIQQGQAPLPVIASSEPRLCGGSSTILSAGSFSSYLWSNNATTATVSTSSPGVYNVTVTNTGGCSASATLNLQAFSLPTANVSTSGPLTFCSGGSVTLTANAGTAFSYKWSNGATTQAITVSQNAGYVVTVYNPCDSVISPAQNVVVNPAPDAQLDPAGSLLICVGMPRVIHALPVGLSYLWLKDGASIPGQTRDSLSLNNAGSYEVVVTQSGCSDTSQTLLVSTAGTGNTVVDITSSKNHICSGDTLSLDAGAGFTTYNWQPGNSANRVLQITGPGRYTANVTLDNGQCTSSGADTVDIVSGPAINAPVLNYDSTVCSGDSIVINVTPNTYTSYSWSNGATTSTLADITGNYILTVSETGFCGTTSASINARGTALPDASFINTSGMLSAVSSIGSYQWLLEGLVINGEISSTYTPAQNGNYSLQVVLNGCSNISAPQLVIVNTIKDLNDIFFISVFPNPVVDLLQFNLELSVQTSMELEILTLDGRTMINRKTVYLSEGRNNLQEDLSGLANGVYVLHMYNESFKKILKLIKQNP